jgi:hypothetical protein
MANLKLILVILGIIFGVLAGYFDSGRLAGAGVVCVGLAGVV